MLLSHSTRANTYSFCNVKSQFLVFTCFFATDEKNYRRLEGHYVIAECMKTKLPELEMWRDRDTSEV